MGQDTNGSACVDQKIYLRLGVLEKNQTADSIKLTAAWT